MPQASFDFLEHVLDQREHHPDDIPNRDEVVREECQECDGQSHKHQHVSESFGARHDVPPDRPTLAHEKVAEVVRWSA